MSIYRVTLHITPDVPPVTGAWGDEAPAQRKYREWVGLYGSGAATIELALEHDDGTRQVLKSWPPAADSEESGGS